MTKMPVVPVLVLSVASALSTADARPARATDTPSVATSPSPSPRRQGRPERPKPSARAASTAPPENHTKVRVVSVDTEGGTMTFTDVEGETSTWRFEPPALAHDPALKPEASVTIIWKSDRTGKPIPTILGVAPVAPPKGGPLPQAPSAHLARQRARRSQLSSPSPLPSPLPSPSPSAPAPR